MLNNHWLIGGAISSSDWRLRGQWRAQTYMWARLQRDCWWELEPRLPWAACSTFVASPRTLRQPGCSCHSLLCLHGNSHTFKVSHKQTWFIFIVWDPPISFSRHRSDIWTLTRQNVVKPPRCRPINVTFGPYFQLTVTGQQRNHNITTFNCSRTKIHSVINSIPRRSQLLIISDCGSRKPVASLCK